IPGKNYFFTASKFVEIWNKKNVFTLFPEKQKAMKWNKEGFIKIIPLKGKLKIEKRSHGNRVLKGVLYFKYKFTLGKYDGYIFKSKNGKVGEIRFIYNNKIMKFNFINTKPVDLKYKGKYIIESKLTDIFRKESGFFKDKLDKYGQVF
ncbi:hypothetical protein J7L48_08515, partial [bacterium]|nr:hypothetical protein [bacterium]